MAVLTVPAALALAATCGGNLDPSMLVGIARQESGLETAAVHRNPNGSTDWGLMQINSSNFALLSLDEWSAMDPCRSFAAGAKLLTLFSQYNTGSAERGFRNGYVVNAVTAYRAIRKSTLSGPEGVAAGGHSLGIPPVAACPEPDPDGWRVIARQPGCSSVEDGADTGWRVVAGGEGEAER